MVNAIPTRSPVGSRPHRRLAIPDLVRTGTTISLVALISNDVRPGSACAGSPRRSPNSAKTIPNETFIPVHEGPGRSRQKATLYNRGERSYVSYPC